MDGSLEGDLDGGWDGKTVGLSVGCTHVLSVSRQPLHQSCSFNASMNKSQEVPGMSVGAGVTEGTLLIEGLVDGTEISAGLVEGRTLPSFPEDN